MTPEFAAIAFGLISAASWGAGDFFGGLATKKASAYSVVIASQCVGFVLLITLAFIFREPFPTWGEIGWGALAGLLGTLGLVTLYYCLSRGRMGIAAPVSAVITAGLPVVVGAFVEGLPGWLQLVGFALAIGAVWFLSRSEESAFRWHDIGLPLLAGVGFGLFLVVMGQVSDTAVFWPLVAARFASITALSIGVAVRRGQHFPPRETLPVVVLSGILDSGGNGFFIVAAQVGRLDVASIMSSLYPASTVALAWLVLKERITRMQLVGIVAALIAIVLITGHKYLLQAFASLQFSLF